MLHNICERSSVCSYNEAWEYQTDPTLANRVYVLDQPPQREEDEICDAGVAYRTAITDWLAANRPLLKSAW